MNGNASDTSIFPAVSVTTVPAPADAAANRRMTLVVDRDSHRGLSLAIAVLASPDGAPVSTGKGIPPSTNAGAAAAIDVTVISRDRQLSCDVDSTGLALRLVALDDGESESDQYGGLKHTGTVAEPRGALVLDNPPTDQSQEVRASPSGLSVFCRLARSCYARCWCDSSLAPNDGDRHRTAPPHTHVHARPYIPLLSSVCWWRFCGAVRGRAGVPLGVVRHRPPLSAIEKFTL